VADRLRSGENAVQQNRMLAALCGGKDPDGIRTAATGRERV